MRKIFIALALLSGMLSASAQQQVRGEQVDKFHSLSLSGNIKAEVVRGGSNSIEVTLNDADAAKFKWGVSNGVLSISLRPSLGKKSQADVRIVQADTLMNITVDGSEIIADNPQATLLKVAVRGGGRVTAELHASDLEIDVSGNSVAQFSGTSRYLTLRVTERSRVDTRGLECMSVEAQSNMGAEAYISVSERLVVDTKTNGSVFYVGNPPILRGKSSFRVSSNVLNIGGSPEL